MTWLDRISSTSKIPSDELLAPSPWKSSLGRAILPWVNTYLQLCAKSGLSPEEVLALAPQEPGPPSLYLLGETRFGRVFKVVPGADPVFLQLPDGSFSIYRLPIEFVEPDE